MADDVTIKATPNTGDGAVMSAETTLTKDGDLGINKPTDLEASAAPVSAKLAEPSGATPNPALDKPFDLPKPPDTTATKPAEEMAKPVDSTESKPVDSSLSGAADALRVDFTPPSSSQPAPSVNGDQTEPLITASEAGEKSADLTAKPVVEKPVVVSDKEAEAADGLGGDTPSPEEQLSDQVETLTGEIQALESKIEHLAGNGNGETKDSQTEVKESPTASSSTPSMPPPPVNPDTALPPLPDMPKGETASKAEATLPGEFAQKETKPFNDAQAKPEDKSAVATFSDIFSKSDKEKPDKKAEASSNAPTSLMPEAPKAVAEPSAAATIGEVLAFFGILVLAVLLLGPFYKSLISDSLYTTIKAVAWLVAPASLLIAFIVLLFAKGKAMFKIAIFILLLVAIVFYLGVNTNGSISEALNSMLGTLFSAYK